MSETIQFSDVGDIFDELQKYCREQGINILPEHNKDFNRREMVTIFYQYIKRYVVSSNSDKKK